MASNESNKRCIMAIPMTSILIEHGDDFTANGESQFTPPTNKPSTTI